MTDRWQSAKQREAEIDFLIKIVSDHFGVSDRLLLSHCRMTRIVMARHVLRHLMRNELGMRFTEIADVFGQDHGTMVHSSKRVKAMMQHDAELSELMKQFAARLKEFSQRQQQHEEIRVMPSTHGQSIPQNQG